MADVEPLRALHYDLNRTGGLQDVVAPPYDVIGPEQRAELEARSPYNVVRIDLPVGDDPYQIAAQQLEGWRAQSVIVRDEEPALWVLEQDYTGPDGNARRRRGFLARVRVEEYGPGRIRPHERTHPGPREDRLRLTRATKTNLSPIFSLFDDPAGTATAALERSTTPEPWGQATDDDGTVTRMWRVTDSGAIAAITGAAAPAELLIADGHHRYETMQAYADEVGGEGEHRYTLMCLVAMEDPGLTVLPTHRLVGGLDERRRRALERALEQDFQIAPVPLEQIAPPPGEGPLQMGYIDRERQQALRLTLKDQALADAALDANTPAYRRLDTAVLEVLLLKRALGLSDEDIAHLNGLFYARDADEAVESVRSGRYDAAFLMRPTPVGLVRDVAAGGENMPPKSTNFFPKLLTGLLFNPLF